MSRRVRGVRRATTLACGALALAAVVVTGCSSGSTPTTTPTSAPTTTTTPTPSTTEQPGKNAVLFVAVSGNIDAYATQAPYSRQRVVAAGTAPDGTEPHGQICFFPDGSRRFVVAESRPAVAGSAAAAGFGIYQLTGDDVGTYRVSRVAGVVSPSAASTTSPSTYGCAFLADGRLLTTDVGLASGLPTGQLIEWFAPFTSATVAHCIVATGLSSPGGLAADRNGGIDVAASRAPGAGVWRFDGAFPKSAATCGVLDAPTAHIAGAPSRVLAGVAATDLVPAGPDGLSSPSAVAASADGRSLVVTSEPDGVINAYDLSGHLLSRVLAPPKGEQLGTTPRASGTPLGIAVNADGTIFYADPGLVRAADGSVAPGLETGGVWRIAVNGGQAAKPQAINRLLQGPDGVGIFDPDKASGGSASIA